ncbi:hypothetical protein [Nostoc sp.]|uniref:hypothetical protein n=1 Tax=Nostoc sp. TaxID=1180 RepID=UPI002FFCA54D
MAKSLTLWLLGNVTSIIILVWEVGSREMEEQGSKRENSVHLSWNWMNPPLNSVNESLNWMNPPLKSVNESLNWMNPPLNSVNESLNWMNPPLNSVNEYFNWMNPPLNLTFHGISKTSL